MSKEACARPSVHPSVHPSIRRFVRMSIASDVHSWLVPNLTVECRALLSARNGAAKKRRNRMDARSEIVADLPTYVSFSDSISRRPFSLLSLRTASDFDKSIRDESLSRANRYIRPHVSFRFHALFRCSIILFRRFGKFVTDFPANRRSTFCRRYKSSRRPREMISFSPPTRTDLPPLEYRL